MKESRNMCWCTHWGRCTRSLPTLINLSGLFSTSQFGISFGHSSKRKQYVLLLKKPTLNQVTWTDPFTFQTERTKDSREESRNHQCQHGETFSQEKWTYFLSSIYNSILTVWPRRLGSPLPHTSTSPSINRTSSSSCFCSWPTILTSFFIDICFRPQNILVVEGFTLGLKHLADKWPLVKKPLRWTTKHHPHKLKKTGCSQKQKNCDYKAWRDENLNRRGLLVLLQRMKDIDEVCNVSMLQQRSVWTHTDLFHLTWNKFKQSKGNMTINRHKNHRNYIWL